MTMNKRSAVTLAIGLLVCSLAVQGCRDPKKRKSDSTSTGGSTAALTTTVTSPVGGERWTGVQEIRWTTQGSQSHQVDILLSDDSGASYGRTLAQAAPDTGRFVWNTGLHVDGAQYRVRVVPSDSTGNLGTPGESSSDFILDHGLDTTAPVTTLLAPTGGERWAGTRQIRWATQDVNIGTVEIRLSHDGGITFPTVIAGAAPDTGTYDWDTTLVTDDIDLRIRVTAVDTYGNEGNAAESGSHFEVDNAGILYDLDFSAPAHSVGAGPVIATGSAPRTGVSSVQFGSPTVSAQFGGAPEQALAFDSYDGVGDQIRLQLSDLPAYNRYTLLASVVVESAQSTFTILLDTPQIRNLYFMSNGQLQQYVPNRTSGAIGNYTPGQVVEVRIEVDLLADDWEIFIDGNLVHQGTFGGATAIDAIRFSTPVIPNPPGVRAAVDNIRVFGR